MQRMDNHILYLPKSLPEFRNGWEQCPRIQRFGPIRAICCVTCPRRRLWCSPTQVTLYRSIVCSPHQVNQDICAMDPFPTPGCTRPSPVFGTTQPNTVSKPPPLTTTTHLGIEQIDTSWMLMMCQILRFRQRSCNLTVSRPANYALYRSR